MGDLQEGVAGQSLTLAFTMDSVPNTGSVNGSNLWQFIAFGSQNPDGSGTQIAPYNIPLTSAQGSVGVTAGDQAQFTGLNYILDLSGSANCADVPYICVTVSQSSSPSTDFTFEGVPTDSVLTSCEAVTCAGKRWWYI